MDSVDFSVLNEFKELMGEDGADEVRDLVNLYLDDAPNQISAMKDALSGADIEKFQRGAHSFKSSSANIGAFGLQAICQELETMAVESALNDKAQDLVTKAEDEFAKVQIALNGFLTA